MLGQQRLHHNTYDQKIESAYTLPGNTVELSMMPAHFIQFLLDTLSQLSTGRYLIVDISFATAFEGTFLYRLSIFSECLNSFNVSLLVTTLLN